MNYKEFSINSKPELQLRVGKIPPTKLLAIATQINFENLKQTETLFNFALENTEVKNGSKWFPVKLADKEVYCPLEIENDIVALNEIINYFLNEVIAKTFQQSSE